MESPFVVEGFTTQKPIFTVIAEVMAVLKLEQMILTG